MLLQKQKTPPVKIQMANIIFGAQLFLKDEHCIAVSAEMIFFFYGGIVHVHHEIITCERSHGNHQRGTREVEV